MVKDDHRQERGSRYVCQGPYHVWTVEKLEAIANAEPEEDRDCSRGTLRVGRPMAFLERLRTAASAS